MEKEAILKKLNRIEEIATLPAVAVKINRMLHDYDTSIRQVSEAIEKDPPVVTRILRLVNSAFFGLRSKVANIPHAVTLLGFNTVRNAVISVSLLKAFAGKKTGTDFNPTDFWIHSLAVAVTCKQLGEETRLVSPDDCFLGGLVHDIGKVILAQYFQDLFKRVLTTSATRHITFYQAEKDELPVDHARIGSVLAKKWQLPIGLVDAIGLHHCVTDKCADRHLVLMVHLANIIVNQFFHMTPQGDGGSVIYPDARRMFRSQIETVSDWFPVVKTEIDEACRFFLEEEQE